MKRHSHFIFTLPFLLYLAGCDQTRSDLIENIFFTDDEEWLDRNTDEDPYELVDNLCCNDYYPYPLPIDTVIHAVINPDDDLDYFDIQVTDSYAGRLVLTPEDDDIVFRVFIRTLKTEYDALVDTFDDPVGDNDHWTVLYGPSATFTVLVAGARGDYVLGWQHVTMEDGLKIVYPGADDRWRRSNWEIISWASQQSEPVSAALLRGPVIVRFLKSGSDAIYDEYKPELDWHIPDDLEVGTGYRIMIYFTANPKRMNISDEFEIYY